MDKEKLVKHLQDKWGRSSACPMCDGRVWVYPDYVHELRPLLGSLTTPVVPLVCDKCGYTALVNAKVAGLIPTE